jgi:predicted transcriptional regulator
MAGNMNATPETVWAALQEVAASQKEMERLMAKSKAEYDQQVKQSKAEYDERQKKLDARMDTLNEQLGGLHRSLGDLIETLMAGRLGEKFPQYNFSRSFQRIKISDKNKQPVTEIDILLSDDEWAMAVEVKR